MKASIAALLTGTLALLAIPIGCVIYFTVPVLEPLVLLFGVVMFIASRVVARITRT